MNKDFNFAILQESGKLPSLIDRLHSSIMGFDKTREPSFRKRPERSSIPAALQNFFASSDFFYVDFPSMCRVKSISLNKMSIILYYRVKSIFVGRSWDFFQNIVR